VWEIPAWVALILQCGMGKCEKEEEEKNQKYIFCSALSGNFQNKANLFHSEARKRDLDQDN